MSKTIYAVYDDESQLFTAIPSLRSSGLKVTNLQSPFPVHGIDPVLGVPRTRMGIKYQNLKKWEGFFRGSDINSR